jgi:coproporphyrinogen III oxidase
MNQEQHFGSSFQWWFGGGTDLTPYYLDEADSKYFHQILKKACDNHDRSYYKQFKAWCDDYFHIKHRGIIQGVSRLYGITSGGDFLVLCDQKSSYKHVSDFGRLQSYGHFSIPVHALV